MLLLLLLFLGSASFELDLFKYFLVIFLLCLYFCIWKIFMYFLIFIYLCTSTLPIFLKIKQMSPLAGFSSYGSFDWSREIKQTSNVSDQADY